MFILFHIFISDCAKIMVTQFLQNFLHMPENEESLDVGAVLENRQVYRSGYLK